MPSPIDFANNFADFFVEWGYEAYIAGTIGDYGQSVPGGYQPSVAFSAMPPQPVNEGDLIRDIAGEFVRSTEKTYAPLPVVMKSRMTIAGVSYEVDQINDRPDIGGHYKIWLTKIQGDQ